MYFEAGFVSLSFWADRAVTQIKAAARKVILFMCVMCMMCLVVVQMLMQDNDFEVNHINKESVFPCNNASNQNQLSD